MTFSCSNVSRTMSRMLFCIACINFDFDCSDLAKPRMVPGEAVAQTYPEQSLAKAPGFSRQTHDMPRHRAVNCARLTHVSGQDRHRIQGSSDHRRLLKIRLHGAKETDLRYMGFTREQPVVSLKSLKHVTKYLGNNE